MNSITNISPQFKAFVPIKEYSGTPKLPEQGIKYIKKCKSKIVQYNRDIIEIENNISNPDVTSSMRRYYAKKKAIINHLIDYLNNQINMVREYGFHSKMHLEDFMKKREMSNYNKKLDKAFEKGEEFF